VNGQLTLGYDKPIVETVRSLRREYPRNHAALQ
jgi:hypothetical protein